MEKITSVNNDLVKQTVKLQQKKFREIENKFLLEGFKSISEAHNCGIKIEYVFVQEDKTEIYKFINDKIIPTTQAVLKKISTTESAPEAVAVGIQRHYELNDIKNVQRALLLENIKDAGNLGTILRTSAAFGVEMVVLYGNSVDLYNPKVVRSSVGSLWKVPVITVKDFDELKNYFKTFKRIATLPRAGNFLKNFEIEAPYLIMFGSEAEGLSSELIDFATDEVKIEMEKNVESLNLSISCAVVLYKLLIC